ncbi:MAG: DUF3185 family protein [Wenzhouxiangellaceae bacterium]
MINGKIVAVVLLVLGAFLLYMGYQSSQGLDDQISETITGNFTDQTMWYLLGGAISLVAGLVMLVRGS